MYLIFSNQNRKVTDTKGKFKIRKLNANVMAEKEIDTTDKQQLTKQKTGQHVAQQQRRIFGISKE